MTEDQWQRIAPLIPQAKPGGRPRATDPRLVVDAILHWMRSEEGWRQLPRGAPPWKTVHYYYRRWKREGHWTAIEEALSR